MKIKLNTDVQVVMSPLQVSQYLFRDIHCSEAVSREQLFSSTSNVTSSDLRSAVRIVDVE